MSLILDALNRAERERSIGQPVPTIETIHYVDRPAWTVFPWRLIMTGALLMLGAVLLLLGWRYANVSAVTAQLALPRSAELALVPADAGGEKPSLAGPRAGVARAPSEERGAAANGSGHEPARRYEAVRGPAGSEAPLSPPAAVSLSGDEELIGRLYQETARGEREAAGNKQLVTGSPSAPNMGAEQVVVEQAAAEQTVAESVASEPVILPEVPYITDLPMQLRRDIPSLNYSEHLPAEPGGARVRLNGRLLGEGQRVAADLELLAIEEHGIVLQFRGVPFRLPALNRWVNF